MPLLPQLVVDVKENGGQIHGYSMGPPQSHLKENGVQINGYSMGRVLEYPFSNVIENVGATHAACVELSRHLQQAATSGHFKFKYCCCCSANDTVNLGLNKGKLF